MRRIGRWLLRSLIGLILFAAGGLWWAHRAIDAERAPLPAVADIAGARPVDDPPLRLSIINTASQPMARAGVLEADRDPDPGAPFVMSHPSFVLEWADGRILLIDTGMTAEQAIAFGKPIEMIRDAQPMQPHRSTAEALGIDAARVRGVIFTHPHTDHTGGIGALCARVDHDVAVFMTIAQAQRPNYTTRPGLAQIRDAACARPVGLDGGPLMPVPGFPGVSVIDAGGHTPGSQIVIAQVGSGDGQRRYVFVGDIVNNADGIEHDIPKPWVYRTFIIPESESRQQELRRFLKRLEDEAHAVPLVSHDQLSLERSGVESWQ
ncbi:MBL fold metallo-hydrolase [bacterium]|nr:MBL fold metallo-hydrolase [bacterium]